MRLLDLTLSTAAENLALDEALLVQADAGAAPEEILRLWEPAQPLVVLGRSTPWAEVNEENCQRRGIPILRRSSGGAAIVTGPGCLMYAVVASYALRPELRPIDEAHAWALGRLSSSLQRFGPRVTNMGTSDLAIDERKVSGNSMRCKRDHFLYHGTLLYDFPVELMEECLRMPERQPAYRAGRAHGDFVVNLPLDAVTLRRAMIDAFEATEPAPTWPCKLVEQLVHDKYGRRTWNEDRKP